MKLTEADRLSKEEVTAELTALGPEWEFCEKHNAIEKDFTRKNFLDSVSFIEKIAPLAEKADHHPDLLLHDYKSVRVILTTHSAHGITENDFALARAIESIA